MRTALSGVIAAATIAVAAGPSFAADMAVKAPPVMAGPACAQFGGFYLGAQGGTSYYDYRWQDLDAFRAATNDDHQAPNSISSSKFGWNIGPLAGYNWQMNCTVFGIETDWSWSNAKAETDISLLGHGGAGAENWSIASKMRWFGTARLRTGVVVDNLLFYVTGGLAYANFQRDFTFVVPSDPSFEAFDHTTTRLGWTAGIGTEWALNQNWSIKGEVLYMAFARNEQTSTSVIYDPGVSYRFQSEDSMWVSRVGLNYRFGGGAPVLARY
ncbi:MAG: porin family protein [Rhodovulum sp.]|nr:porin family protein [Rhodovulum sp.]